MFLYKLWLEDIVLRLITLSPNPIWLAFLYTTRSLGHSHAQREDHVKAQAENSHLPDKKRGLRRNQLCQYLPWSWTSKLQNRGKINFCCLSHTVWGPLLWEPYQTDIGSWLQLSAWLLMFSAPYYLQMSKFLEVNCIAECWVHLNIFPFPLKILDSQVLVVLLNSRFFPLVLWDHRKFCSASSLIAAPAHFCSILRC